MQRLTLTTTAATCGHGRSNPNAHAHAPFDRPLGSIRLAFDRFRPNLDPSVLVPLPKSTPRPNSVNTQTTNGGGKTAEADRANPKRKLPWALDFAFWLCGRQLGARGCVRRHRGSDPSPALQPRLVQARVWRGLCGGWRRRHTGGYLRGYSGYGPACALNDRPAATGPLTVRASRQPSGVERTKPASDGFWVVTCIVVRSRGRRQFFLKGMWMGGMQGGMDGCCEDAHGSHRAGIGKLQGLKDRFLLIDCGFSID